eukprot:m51a1_g4325 hypothetical protein (1522) ;mRNA; r:85386-91550
MPTINFTGKWGDWGDWDLCPNGALAVGMCTRSAGDSPAGTTSALNAIALYCQSPLNSTREGLPSGPTSLEGTDGTWDDPVLCPDDYFAVGFTLRWQPAQSLASSNTAANQLKFFCKDRLGNSWSSGAMGNLTTVERRTTHGDWVGDMWCPNGTAIAGLRTQVQTKFEPHTRTGLNGVAFACHRYLRRCSEISGPEECIAPGSGCNWCGAYCREEGECPTCSNFTTRAECRASNTTHVCSWCGTSCRPQGQCPEPQGQCPECRNIPTRDECLASNVVHACSWCGSYCRPQSQCPKCANISTSSECLASSDPQGCSWCGSHCGSECPSCANITARAECLASNTTHVCSWCDSSCVEGPQCSCAAMDFFSCRATGRCRWCTVNCTDSHGQCPALQVDTVVLKFDTPLNSSSLQELRDEIAGILHVDADVLHIDLIPGTGGDSGKTVVEISLPLVKVGELEGLVKNPESGWYLGKLTKYTDPGFGLRKKVDAGSFGAVGDCTHMRRFKAFSDNVARIEHMNRQGSAKFAVNRYSDLTPEEFSALYTGLEGRLPIKGSRLPDSLRAKRANIPQSYFHRSVTPNCIYRTFAATGVLEASYKTATGQTQQFSTQQLVDCARRGNGGMGAGCQGGNYQMAFDYLKQHAAMLESAYPYTERNGYCQEKDAGLTKVVSWNYIDWEDESQIMNAVMTYGPIGVCLNGAQISSYSSGVLSTSDGTCSDKVDHAVVLVGWTTVDGVPAWIIKNSWGDDWGVKPVGWTASGSERNSRGFMYVKRGAEGCGITQFAASYVQQTDAKGGSGGASDGGHDQCAPKTAQQACPSNAQCGSVSDGCEGSVSCGSCRSGFACQDFQCAQKCTPRRAQDVCRERGLRCGQVDLGCNVAGDCGQCPRTRGSWRDAGTQQVCRNGQCVDPQPQCTPNDKVCADRQCGTFDDGCGNKVLCGSCDSGAVCDAGRCTAACTPSDTCSSQGFTCGRISDGCSGTVSCGTCPSGQSCVQNKCAARPAQCTPRTREELCGSAECGPTVDDGCGHSVDCGKCSNGFFCGSDGRCSQRCAPKTAQEVCDASWQCGSASDGCGNALQCGQASGTCPSGSACSDHRCVPLSTDSDWEQVVPAGANAGWTVGPTQGVQGSVTLASTSAAEKQIRWVSSVQWSRAKFVSYSFVVRASGPATLGIGARMGKQPHGDGDRVFWRLTIDVSGNAELRQYSVLQGREQQGADDKGPIGIAFRWDSSAEHNLTVSFQDDGSNIVMVPLLDGAGIYGTSWDSTRATSFSVSPSEYWSNTGAAFVVLAGTNAYARTAGPAEVLATRSTVALQFRRCTTEPSVRNYVKRTCQVGDDAIEGIAPRTACSGGATVWDVTFRDARDARNLGGQVGFFSAGVPNMQYSADLASTLASHVNTGNPAAAGFPATGASIVPSPLLPTAAAVPVAVAATAAATAAAAGGLGAGAIAGIVVGSVVGAALVAAGVGAAVYVSRLPEPEGPIPEDFQPRNPFRKTAYKVKAKKGVDVINMDGDHRSITARAPPIA